MADTFSHCSSLQQDVTQVLQLLHQEPGLRSQQDTTPVQGSLKKAVSPTFEIVFAGAFSAGKSMLINALLGRKLLYSAEGHATGTECRIAYAEDGQERVVLTFLSEAEVREQIQALIGRLQLQIQASLQQPGVLKQLEQICQSIIQEEGGETRSDKAKQANALKLLLEGYSTNRDRLSPNQNATYSMEQFNFSNLQEAASYARRGSNSAVLKRIEYFCCHDLLKDGNVLIDTPGIDAPVRKDAELTYAKIEDPDTSAVVCVLKTAETGELTAEETELLEKIRRNPSIRDRVFYVFNRVDRTWYNTQLRQRLDQCISNQFQDTTRVFRTSGLLGFYGRQLKETDQYNRFGLDSLFAEEVQGQNGHEEVPLFVTEFNNYCGNSGKLIGSEFRPEIRGYESPNENYLRILSSYGTSLIDQLIEHSGVEQFRQGITRYLQEEKRPLLFSNLADDLHPVCIALRKLYLEQWQAVQSQPQEIEAIKSQKLRQLSKDLKNVGDRHRQDMEALINQTVASNGNAEFERDFRQLQAKMVSRLDELLNTFSVEGVYQQAQASHRRNSVVPLLGILSEAFYYLANGLEDLLVSCSEELTLRFFQQLISRVQTSDYSREIYRLLGNDGGIEQRLHQVQQQVTAALINEARTECDRYVRERPEFFSEGTASVWQLRQTLQQSCRGYDYQSMIDAEPAIRQLLKLDFEQKVGDTVLRTFRQTINQTLNSHLLSAAQAQADSLLHEYDHARAYLAQTLDKEAAEKVIQNQRLKVEIQTKVELLNEAISGINACLEVHQLDRKKLSLISRDDLVVTTSDEDDLEASHAELDHSSFQFTESGSLTPSVLEVV
ncbi:dynamin family protein [Pseudanabaena sp. FACHB-2040]|uniref:dynamin family protein n=1 Tax=Pseudanabaena sp. FACHB-2040 TaxID=2692859 RepID=UPI001686176A|nr:dynamin family protein [Pseudanabaena sp. FACHB-2040]MBD2256551.1 dynamin family protein [Pseudanabaena sp. FACHB-2040]